MGNAQATRQPPQAYFQKFMFISLGPRLLRSNRAM